jgi:hypothetical protein
MYQHSSLFCTTLGDKEKTHKICQQLKVSTKLSSNRVSFFKDPYQLELTVARFTLTSVVISDSGLTCLGFLG